MLLQFFNILFNCGYSLSMHGLFRLKGGVSLLEVHNISCSLLTVLQAVPVTFEQLNLPSSTKG